MFALILDRKESRAGTKYYSVSYAHKRTGGAVFWDLRRSIVLGNTTAACPPLDSLRRSGDSAAAGAIPGKVCSGFPLAIAEKQKAGSDPNAEPLQRTD
ncbi:hypothetical protein [Mesorhizobium ciceri]|uniref:hypothetical protein n=1 Tax=Mesorhizobium ciceri TaxID=39645 RepID=UPI0013E8DF8B